MRRALLGAALALLVIGCGTARHESLNAAPVVSARAGTWLETLRLDGRLRTYTLHVPNGLSDARRRPLVLVLHGGSGDGRTVERETHFDAVADQDTFVVAYPNGTGHHGWFLFQWNLGGGCCGYASEHNVDDVAFMRALVRQIATSLPIDTSRVYAAGFSDGGTFSYRLACEASDLIAGIAVVGGTMPLITCSPARPVSVIAFHGTKDTFVPYDDPQRDLRGRAPRDSTTVPSVIADWGTRDGCRRASRAEPMPTMPTVVVTAYEDCRDGTGVALWTLVGGQHAWPGGSRSTVLMPRPTTMFAASRVAMDFFAAHPRR